MELLGCIPCRPMEIQTVGGEDDAARRVDEHSAFAGTHGRFQLSTLGSDAGDEDGEIGGDASDLL